MSVCTTSGLSMLQGMQMNNGLYMPSVGLGVYLAEPEETYHAVLHALNEGYRHIDTAVLYANEAEVGKAVTDSGIPREEIFVTSKMPTWEDTIDGYTDAIRHVDESLARMGLDYIDLYLLHSPHHPEQRLNKWKGLEKCVDDGKLKSIGVSNFGIHHMKEFLDQVRIKPVTNQIEVHTFLARTELVEFCQKNDVIVQAYSPLAKAKFTDNEVVNGIATAHGKTWAQVMLKHQLARGCVILPKSVKKDRIVQNADMFGWELTEAELEALNGLDKHVTTGWDPTVFD